ncbi:MAG: EutN/CcmL family microcompartment protein [Planctomycetota bacterium]
MQRARIIGKAIATAKHPSMEGFRMLVGVVLGAHGQVDGDPILIVDTLGAGIGATVLLTNDGRYARQLVGSENSPVRYTTLGLEDD